MTQGPTIINGPLHTDDATLGDRKIVAYFATEVDAGAVRNELIGAGVPAESITVAAAAAEAPKLVPADQSLVGKIREAVLPDDSQRATRDAVANQDIVVTVWPGQSDVEQVVAIIQAGHPHHFDADLERWRNSRPA